MFSLTTQRSASYVNGVVRLRNVSVTCRPVAFVPPFIFWTSWGNGWHPKSVFWCAGSSHSSPSQPAVFNQTTPVAPSHLETRWALVPFLALLSPCRVRRETKGIPAPFCFFSLGFLFLISRSVWIKHLRSWRLYGIRFPSLGEGERCTSHISKCHVPVQIISLSVISKTVLDVRASQKSQVLITQKIMREVLKQMCCCVYIIVFKD